MAGMSAAAMAAARGRRVVVVERDDRIGGSAVLSGGVVWVYESLATHFREVPGSDLELAPVLLDHFDEATEWIASLGVDLGPRQEIGAFPGSVGHRIDVPSYIAACCEIVERADGTIVTGATIRTLRRDGDRITGGMVISVGAHDDPGQPDDPGQEVRADVTLLATGGFHSDPDLRATYLGPGAGSMLANRTTTSDGTGIRLGLAVGAATTDGMDDFYGDLMAHPTPDHAPGEYLRYAQSMYVAHCVLVSRDGTRFVDESLGYPGATPAVAHQRDGRAVVIGDEWVRREVASRAPVPGLPALDRVGVAEAAGAHVARADELAKLALAIEPWGYPADVVARTVTEFNDALTANRDIDPGRLRHRRPLAEPPFFAVELRPQISFTYGGLRIDESSRVLDAQGRAVPGLYAAGVDGAGLHRGGYAGRLAIAVVFAQLAVDHAF
jgi:succinate dehydrogenase/fumarate reductase flavoprotein subunit